MSALFKTTQSDLRQHNGKPFSILEQINPSSYDYVEVGPMYRILLSTGEELEAFKDELI